MAGRSSNAIDYSAQGSAARPLRKPSTAPQKKNNVVSLPRREQPVYLLGRGMSMKTLIQGILVCAAVFVVIAIVVVNKARLDDVNNKLAHQEAILHEMKERYNQMSVDAQAKVNIRDVEEYANNVLGMQLPERYQIEIMGQPKGDKVVLGEGEPAEGGRDLSDEWREISTAAVHVLAYLESSDNKYK